MILGTVWYRKYSKDGTITISIALDNIITRIDIIRETLFSIDRAVEFKSYRFVKHFF